MLVNHRSLLGLFCVLILGCEPEVECGPGQVPNPERSAICYGVCPPKCIDERVLASDAGSWAPEPSPQAQCWNGERALNTRSRVRAPDLNQLTPEQCVDGLDVSYAAEVCQQSGCATDPSVDCLVGVDDNCNGCIDEQRDCYQGPGDCVRCGGRVWPANSYELKPSAYSLNLDAHWSVTAESLDCEGVGGGCEQLVFEARYVCASEVPTLNAVSTLLHRPDTQCLIGPNAPDNICGDEATRRWLLSALRRCGENTPAWRVEANAGERLTLEVASTESDQPQIPPNNTLPEATAQLSAIITCFANLHAVANTFGGTDANGDGTPDHCQDPDHDGVLGEMDNCPQTANPEQVDRDQDGRGDKCDNCPMRPNRDQLDTDADGIGDLCCADPDVDGDFESCMDTEGDPGICEKLANDCAFWPQRYIPALRERGYHREGIDPEPLDDTWPIAIHGTPVCIEGRRTCTPPYLPGLPSTPELALAAALESAPDEVEPLDPVVIDLGEGELEINDDARTYAAVLCNAWVDHVDGQPEEGVNPIDHPPTIDRNGDTEPDGVLNLNEIMACREDVLQALAEGHDDLERNPRRPQPPVASPVRVGRRRVGMTAEAMVYHSSEFFWRGDCTKNRPYSVLVEYADGTVRNRRGEDDIICEGADYSPMPNWLANALYGQDLCQGWDVKLLRTYGKGQRHGRRRPPYWSWGRKVKQRDQMVRYSHHQEQHEDYLERQGACVIGFLPVFYPPSIFVEVIEGRWNPLAQPVPARGGLPERLRNALRPVDPRHRFKRFEDPRWSPAEIADEIISGWRTRKIWVKWTSSPFRKTPGLWDDGPLFKPCRGTPEYVAMCTAASRSLAFNYDNWRQAIDPSWRRQAEAFDLGALSAVTRPYITGREAVLFHDLCAYYISLSVAGAVDMDPNLDLLCDRLENEWEW